MLGRLLRPAEFESVLATPIRARSAHFAAHHLPKTPVRVGVRAPRARDAELSTVDPDDCAQPVDDALLAMPGGWWFGTVVPKRHARKATTRNLLRRQIRGAMTRHHPALAHGMWLVRLRAPFDERTYTSAASRLMRTAAREELDGLLMRAAS
jgi:ribonuclease P protein component